jgi:hypothetical protein
MGQYNSSRTRVAPTFNWLQCWDQTGIRWLAPLLRLASEHREQLPIMTTTLREARWWPREVRLPVAPSLLQWLVANCVKPTRKEGWGSKRATREYRERLVSRHVETCRDAHGKIAAGQISRAPHVLEGPSQPDAFLKTDELLLVVEGKRSEPAPTVETEWMSVRHQMLRHLDGAWEQRGKRQVFGMLIIDETTPNKNAWEDYPAILRSPAALSGSLPHRSATEQKQIAECFLGITTWQTVGHAFSIPPAAMLPNVV